MANLYLNGILEKEGFYFIKPLLGKAGKPGFLDCIGYLTHENGKILLKTSAFADLEVDPEVNPNCPWPL